MTGRTWLARLIAAGISGVGPRGCRCRGVCVRRDGDGAVRPRRRVRQVAGSGRAGRIANSASAAGRPESRSRLAPEAGIPPERMARAACRPGRPWGCCTGDADARSARPGGARRSSVCRGSRQMIAHHDILYRDLADPVALLRGEVDTELAEFWPYVFGAAGCCGRDSHGHAIPTSWRDQPGACGAGHAGRISLRGVPASDGCRRRVRCLRRKRSPRRIRICASVFSICPVVEAAARARVSDYV